MDTQQALELARQYKAAVLARTKLPVKAVYLFGSYAKGNYREESDIDIAVEVEHYLPEYIDNEPALWHLTWDISTLIEPILLGPGGYSPIREEVMRTGIEV